MTRDSERGFTVVELAITMGIAMAVMSSILGILVSQSNAERRVSDFADNQEILRQAMVAMQRDIRSAEPLEPLASSEAYAVQVRLNVYEDISQAPVPIRWIVDTANKELRRELIQVTPNASGPPTITVIGVTYRVRGVVNDFAVGNHLFNFYRAEGTAFTVGGSSGNAPADIAHCTVRVQINLRAAPTPGTTPVLLESDAQLRNRLPGGIGCATAPVVTP